MKNYRKYFKKYLDDLGKRSPSPGGGSALSLIFCVGLSLLTKAVRYSYPKKALDKQMSVQMSRFRQQVQILEKLKKKIVVYVDKDGQVFEKIMKTRGKARFEFIRESERILIDVARACQKAFFLAKQAESGIKKSILSDFTIGLACLKSVLAGCIVNLQANRILFGRSSKCVHRLAKSLARM